MRYSPKTTQTNMSMSQYLNELRERFARHLYLHGSQRHHGTKRYQYEVDFAYLENEIMMSATCLHAKLLESMTSLVNSMISSGKALQQTRN